MLKNIVDVTIVTSDNPRREDPHGIIEDILEGINKIVTLLLKIEKKL